MARWHFKCQNDHWFALLQSTPSQAPVCWNYNRDLGASFLYKHATACYSILSLLTKRLRMYGIVIDIYHKSGSNNTSLVVHQPWSPSIFVESLRINHLLQWCHGHVVVIICQDKCKEVILKHILTEEHLDSIDKARRLLYGDCLRVHPQLRSALIGITRRADNPSIPVIEDFRLRNEGFPISQLWADQHDQPWLHPEIWTYNNKHECCAKRQLDWHYGNILWVSINCQRGTARMETGFSDSFNKRLIPSDFFLHPLVRSEYLELEAKASSQTSLVQDAPVTFKKNDPNSGQRLWMLGWWA